MKKIYKAHILYTKEKNRFEVLENGYVAVDANGRVTAVSANLQSLDSEDAEVIDFGDSLLIPAMNDMHVHAPQYRNQGIAMDLELLPWLQNYTFPEEMKYADTHYAERMYRRFVRPIITPRFIPSCTPELLHACGELAAKSNTASVVARKSHLDKREKLKEKNYWLSLSG